MLDRKVFVLIKYRWLGTWEGLYFVGLVRTGNYPTPNEFTVEMGKLIRKARKEMELSQVELAELVNRRPATISDMENQKSV